VASYSLSHSPSVENVLQSIPRGFVARIIAKIERLPSEPFPAQSARLQGAERLYPLRVGDYRVVSEVDTEALHIIVQYIRHRREV
jgi:mRNA interferase RelE/StbE